MDELETWTVMFSIGATTSMLLTPVIMLYVMMRRRKRGVVVGRHYIATLDIFRSLLYSIRGAKRHEMALLVVFLMALLQRRRLTKIFFSQLWNKGLALVVKKQVARHVMQRRSSWMTLGAVLWFAHWRRSVCERPLVSCQRTFWNVAIVEKAGFAKHEFRPVFWATSRHAQTVLAHVIADLSFLFLPPVQWRREAVPTHDGGEVHLDWVASNRSSEFEPYGDGLTVKATPQNGCLYHSSTTSLNENATTVSQQNLFLSSVIEDPSTPIALLMYGIGGTRDDHYLKHLALACRARGWRPVVLSYWRLDWNEWRDVDAAVKRIATAYPLAPLFAVAHSASAYILVQYLAQVGDKTPIVAAISVSGCMDFLRAYDFVKHTKNRTYRGVFERGMRRCVRRHHAHDPTLDGDEKQSRAARLLRIRAGADVMYDRHVAALNNATHLPLSPVNGENEDDDEDPAFSVVHNSRRRRRSSMNKKKLFTVPAQRPPKPPGGPSPPQYMRSRTVALLERTQPHYRTPARVKLSQVAVPLLLLHARDDPLVSHDDNYDWPEAIKNPRIITVRTNRGGHCGWHEGLWPVGPSWAVAVAVDYVSAVLEQTHQTGWLCAVFDTLHRNRPAQNGHIAASTIAHAACQQTLVMPQTPTAPSSFNAFHSFLFDDDNRSSRAPSVCDDLPAVTNDDDIDDRDLDDELLHDGLQQDEDTSFDDDIDLDENPPFSF